MEQGVDKIMILGSQIMILPPDKMTILGSQSVYKFKMHVSGVWVGGGSHCGLQASHVSSGFAYTMSSKVKKRKVNGRGSARKQAARAALAAQDGLPAQALEGTELASQPEPKPEPTPEPTPEPLEEEPGGYMLPGVWRENVCVSGGS